MEVGLSIMPVYEVADGLGSNLSLAYLGTLVVMLLGAAYIVVRQVVMRVEMDEAVKRLGDNIRAGNATSEVGFYNLEFCHLPPGILRTRCRLDSKEALRSSDQESGEVYQPLG